MAKRSFGDMLGEGSASSSKDSDSIQLYRNRYDVFISFSGVDTRNTFVDHLYAHLVRKGIIAFKDDIRLEKGGSISPQLLEAIKHSQVSIVVFSKNYASSSWCLDEMAAIDESRKNLKQVVFPVFYDVDPSHVRKQNGVYENAVLLHPDTLGHDLDKATRWRKAMTNLAGSAGWDIRNQPEFKMIEEMVEVVLEKLGRVASGSIDDFIGIQPHIEALESLLKLRSEDDGCRVLGIWGMDGIGKTTLATVLYDRISNQFDASCFIENVSKIYEDGGAIAVQKQILRETIKEKNVDTYSPQKISQIMFNMLHKIKLLIVLDNVQQLQELEELDIKTKFFHTRSRIITITRDKHILEAYGADEVFEAKLMNDEDAVKLLCRKAFYNDSRSGEFAELIPKVLLYAQRLPLAVKVLGSFLLSKNATQWISTLDEFENNTLSKIMKVLHTSYEGLEQDEKEIFLHVACFFNGERKAYVSRILHACGMNPVAVIPLLAEKSLITIRNEEIHMHEMLHKLGKQIVREQHPHNPRLWSRLWLYHDFHYAMVTESDAIKAKAIILNQKEDVSKFNQLRAENLSKMENLEVLILNHRNFSGRPITLSDSLCYLLWNGYPFTSLPSNFQPYQLVELNMPHSSIEQLWIGTQNLPNLKRMDLSNSKYLKMSPCFKGILNLERLDFAGCISLCQVDSSIGLLTKLVFLSLQNCTDLVSLDFGHAARLRSLKVLRLSDCTKLEKTSDFSGLSSLQYLDMDRCVSLSRIHESIGALAKLSFFSLRDCTNLVGIPDSLNELASLITLDLCGCSKVTNLPLGWISISPLQSLVYLDLSFCNIYELSYAIKELKCLERLNLQGNNFTTIPSTLSFNNLSYLNLSHCHRLQSIPELPEAGLSSSAGRYFKTTSGSRNQRSGFYIFDSPKCLEVTDHESSAKVHFHWCFLRWVRRLLQEPLHFRCGLDIVLPWDVEANDYDSNIGPSKFFHHRFEGGSIVRIHNSVMHANYVGFLFYATFEINNHDALSSSPRQPLSSPTMPHPFYLSFESEHTEQRFDMPLNLERNNIQDSEHLWLIYISQEHCHFVKTGSQITFKARRGLVVKEWGLRVVTKKDIEGSETSFILRMGEDLPLHLQFIDNAEESTSWSNKFEPKIQLPYNWLVSDKDAAEMDEANRKERDLFDLGLLTERPQ